MGTCGACDAAVDREGGVLFCSILEESVGPEDGCETDYRPKGATCGTCGCRVAKAESETGWSCSETSYDVAQSQKACPAWEAVEETTTNETTDEGTEESMEEDRKPDREVKKTKVYLKYTFSREEKEEFAAELARKLGELEQNKLRKKEVVKAIDSEIASIESQVSKLASNVKDGYEYRNVECEVVFDYESRMKETIRMDSFETVKREPMTADELQRVFDFN